MEILAKETIGMKKRRNGRVAKGRKADRHSGANPEAQLDTKPAKRLSDALADAWPDFQAIDVDDCNGTAWGIIPNQSGFGPTATLGFTQETGLLRIDVELGRPIDSQILVLLELPFQTRWTRTMCGRDGVAWLRAATKCENVGIAGPAIQALARDLCEAHQNELLLRAMGDEWASEHHRRGGVV